MRPAWAHASSRQALALVVALSGCRRDVASTNSAHDADAPPPMTPSAAASSAPPTSGSAAPGSSLACPSSFDLRGWTLGRWTTASTGTYRVVLDKNDQRFGRMRLGSLHVDAEVSLTLEGDRASMCIDGTTLSSGKMPARAYARDGARGAGPTPNVGVGAAHGLARAVAGIALRASGDGWVSAAHRRKRWNGAVVDLLACAEAASSDGGAPLPLLICATVCRRAAPGTASRARDRTVHDEPRFTAARVDDLRRSRPTSPSATSSSTTRAACVPSGPFHRAGVF